MAILGAGLAGLSAAWHLSQFNGYQIVIIEKEDYTGGLSATIPFGNNRFDLGSHRIHAGYPKRSLEFIRSLLGNSFLTRPRDGRLIASGWTIPYPLSPGGMLGAIGLLNVARFALSRGAGAIRKLSGARNHVEESYQKFLTPRVGELAFQTFHAPYARKLYGITLENISSQAADIRLDSISPFGLPCAKGKMAKNFFHYPSDGFGVIGTALLQDAKRRGVKVITGATISGLTHENGAIKEISFTAQDGAKEALDADEVISTIPISQLVHSIKPLAPDRIVRSAEALKFRGVRLLQLVIARDKFLDGETYYFPEEKYIFGRISEPKCFSPLMCQGKKITTLNVEVIVTPDDTIWKMDHHSFLKLVIKDMEKVFTFNRADITDSRSIFLRNVYPVYDLSFRANLDNAREWLGSFPNLHTIGRGGLFFHGNADHSIELGLKAAEQIARASTGAPSGRNDDIGSFKVRV